MNSEILKYRIGEIDTHLHSKHSCDSTMEPVAACRRAMEAGLRAIVFTEHVDFDPTDQGYGVYNDKAIESSLADCRVMAGKHLKVYKGVEITYQPQYRDDIEKFINSYKFDFVIGSVHMVGENDISRPDLSRVFYEHNLEEEAYNTYFQEVLKLIDSQLFDCLGHLDICKKYGYKHYGPLSWKKFQKPIKKILQRAVQRNIIVEINTSGLRQDPKETYPSLTAVREFLKMGGTRLTLGSDSHQVEHIAHGFHDIINEMPELKGLTKR